MKWALFRCVAVLTPVVFVGMGCRGSGQTTTAKPSQASLRQVPVFQVDPTWPKMPNDWLLGQTPAVTVDAQDNVYILHRFRTVRPEFKQRAAPPVVEFDSDGNFIRAWGGPGEGYEWPSSEHGIAVDQKGFVWIGGEGRGVNQILKFTKEGKFVMQIGKSGASKGMTDTENFVGPADMTVYPKTNELFVGDTSGHGRVIVMDPDTGKFKRMWGGFGHVPEDPAENEISTPPSGGGKNAGADVDDGGDPPQLTEAHRIRVSDDGLVYVCDGPNKRFQVFTVEGKFVKEVYVGRGHRPESAVPVVTTSGDAVTAKWGEAYTPVALEQLINHHETSSGLALSSDPQQEYLYVYERSRSKALIYDRKSLELIGEFGDGPGRAPGQFFIMHDLRADSHGNVYIAEVNIGSRVQKFILKGYMPLPTSLAKQ
jgi:DNA-binding beta-propeller fold protein YncE